MTAGLFVLSYMQLAFGDSLQSSRGQMTNQTPEEQDQTIEDHIADLKVRYPVLFAGGDDAPEAVRALLLETAKQVHQVSRSIALDDAAESLALILQNDLNAFAKDGLSEDDRITLASKPDEALYAILQEAYRMVIHTLQTLNGQNVRVVPDAEKCDCPAHQGMESADGDLDGDFGPYVNVKGGQA